MYMGTLLELEKIKSYEDEVWKIIPEYKWMAVSNYGRVYSFSSNALRKTRINGSGYVSLPVALGKGKDGKRKQKTVLVHRLVAQAFVDNPLDKQTVNHKDEDKLNNKANNLEWMTLKENQNYGTRNIRQVLHNPNRKRVLQVDCASGNVVAEFQCIRQASRITGVHPYGIASCCKGKYKHAGGYKWKFLE